MAALLINKVTTRLSKLKGFTLFTIIILGLISCAEQQPIPVVDIGQASFTAKTYTVQAGDTLYSIAFRFSLDAKTLASINDIRSPYTIYPNQILNLKSGQAVAKNGSKASVERVRNSLQNSSSNSSSRNSKVTNTKASNVSGKPTTKSQTMRPSPNEKGWLWPVKGKVIEKFSATKKLNKGIDIAAPLGTPVVSSRSGSVVYAGNRLKGYGNLIIVKHNNDYLSAYAHNKSLLVKEGDWVKQGQKIATLGDSSANQPKLHFEIRKRGKPLNPLSYLGK